MKLSDYIVTFLQKKGILIQRIIPAIMNRERPLRRAVMPRQKRNVHVHMLPVVRVQ